MKRKRKLLVVAVSALALIVLVAGGWLWFVKPWAGVELVDPGPTGRRIQQEGIFANYFPAKRNAAPAVLLFGGSEGGIGAGVNEQAVSLQSAGFSVLAMSYFGAPSQPGNLELVPLETFDRALEWLRAQPEVDPKRVAVAGHSKGSEAALVVGVRHSELAAVVASAPTSAVWPGINWFDFDPASSWSSKGTPLPAVPYGGVALFGDIGRLYREGLKTLPVHPDAAIAVERISGAVMLVCGEADDLWPACEMSRQLRARALREGGPPVKVLAYEGAGHRVFGPGLAESTIYNARRALELVRGRGVAGSIRLAFEPEPRRARPRA